MFLTATLKNMMYIMLCLQAIFLYHAGFCVCIGGLKLNCASIFYIVQDFVCIGSLNSASICILYRILCV